MDLIKDYPNLDALDTLLTKESCLQQWPYQHTTRHHNAISAISERNYGLQLVSRGHFFHHHCVS